MKPDEVVDVLGKVWGLSTTRRTVLAYEKDGLTTPPYIETGKYKEYPATVVAEFIASWCLIHGDYGIKPKKAAEIRRRSLQILYSFSDVWRDELPGISDTLHGILLKGKNWQKVGDFFVFTWIMIREGIRCGGEDQYNPIKAILQSGNINLYPSANVSVNYLVSESSCKQTGISTVFETRSTFGDTPLEGKGKITLHFDDKDGPFFTPREIADMWDCEDYSVKTAGYQESASLTYIHPEEYVLARPVI